MDTCSNKRRTLAVLESMRTPGIVGDFGKQSEISNKSRNSSLQQKIDILNQPLSAAI